MTLVIPAATRSILDAFDKDRPPTVDYEVAGQLSGLHQAEGLTDPERKGAWAEASAFNFHPMEDGSPWETYYGPIFTATKTDGTPFCAPDIAEIDEEMVTHWEERATTAQHPVLRARYADVVWDLKKRAINKPADVQYAHRAIDAYLDGVTQHLYKDPPIHAVQASRRALHLALNINDQTRAAQCKAVMLTLFDEGRKPGHTGVWTMLYDALSDSKKVGLSEETNHLTAGLERMLTACSTLGDPYFDPWGAEAAARRLAAHYERQGKKDDVQRVIRIYASAFEQLAAQANPMLAMGWLQPVHDEFRNRGMHEDAARVAAASAEKGKHIASDLKEVRVPITLTQQELDEFVIAMTQGTAHDALTRIAAHFIPKTGKAKELLQNLLTTAPLMARIRVTRIVGDHFAAHAGSIEEDPDGRLIMQLAQTIELQNLFLHATLDHLRTKNALTADDIMAALNESPVFATEQRALIQEGVQAYLNGDHTKTIHVLIPQLEQALRHLLTLMRIPTLKPGRNGTMQLKILSDILREQAIKEALGEDLRFYLLTFLADERGQNMRNIVCHGLATPAQFNQRLADQTLHALLAISLVRQKAAPPPAGMTLLFQYGSNCDEQRLNQPNRLDGAATNPELAETVDEYDLAFDVPSKKNQCAASDLIPAPGTGRHAIGILYQVPTDLIRGDHPDGKKTVTQIEGPAYEEHMIRVRTATGEYDALTFLVKEDAQRDGLWTSSEYVQHIVNGLRTHHAPTGYVERVIDTATATNQRAQADGDDMARTIAEQTDAIARLRIPDN